MRILCIGAHPDDCEGSCGGLAALLAEQGHRITFLVVSNGSKGHFDEKYLKDPNALIERRKQESLAACSLIGAGYENLGVPDGEVVVDLPSTQKMVAAIRQLGPDLILTNRPNDYHRDHRYSARLVLDSAYLLGVPFFCSDVPAMRTTPVIAYWSDDFTEEGGPFRADFVVPIDRVMQTKLAMKLAHESQYFEWIPWNWDLSDGWKGLPEDALDRREAIQELLVRESRETAAKYVDRLPKGTEFAEAYQISEYGRTPDAGFLTALFQIG